MKTAMQELIEWFDVKIEILENEYSMSIAAGIKAAKMEAEQLLEKEKEQIKEAFDFGDYCVELPLNEREGDYTWGKKYKSAEEYYNQTYNQNK